MKIKKRDSLFIIILIMIFTIFISYIMIYFLNENISNAITATTAIIGAIAIWYQLKKDHDIAKAEFIFNLNTTFSNDEKITFIYNKFKEFRDDNSLVFSPEDGRKMGDYIMYFEIINYLINDNIINIIMVDKLFTSRFFIMSNNPYVHKYQLNSPAFTSPIYELYCRWYNYRIKLGKGIPYAKFALHKAYPQSFERRKNGELVYSYK